MKCEFEHVGAENGRQIYRCVHCGGRLGLGRVVEASSIRRACNSPPVRPNLFRRAINFTKATAKHLLHGSPKASSDEIQRRMSICRTCDLFDGKICTHKRCGCNVNTEHKFLNKLAWADQSCPDKHWGPEQLKPLRVCVVTPFLCFGGGVEQWLHSLLTYMPKDIQFSIGLLTNPSLEYLWDMAGIDYLRDLAPVVVGERVHAEITQSDLVIAWYLSSPSHWFPGRFDKPTILVNHGANEFSKSILEGARDWVDRFVAVGTAALALDPENSILIENGVDVARCRIRPGMRDTTRLQLGLPPDALVVGQIGRLIPEKDSQAVSRAVQSLGPQAWGLLVGRGNQEYIDEAKRIAGGRLIHHQPTADIAPMLAAMDSFLFGSVNEGFGLAIAEAWAAGLPTVSTRVGVVDKHPECSVLVPVAADSDTLATAVRESLRRERVTLARQTVAKHYSAQRMAKQWRKLIRDTHREYYEG